MGGIRKIFFVHNKRATALTGLLALMTALFFSVSAVFAGSCSNDQIIIRLQNPSQSHGSVWQYDRVKGVFCTGTETMISDCQGLQDIDNNMAGDYCLANDIDCSATSGWNGGDGFEPIGDSSNPFTGTLNGDGYVVKDLYIKKTNIYDAGLFEETSSSAIIMNIGLVDVSITGASASGLVVLNNGGKITNAFTTGRIQSINSNCGGLVGKSIGGLINASHSDAEIGGNGINAGGIVGDNDGGIISLCYYNGRFITTRSFFNAGGLVGSNWNPGLITDSYSVGFVSQGLVNTGGLVGQNLGEIINSYAAGYADCNVVGSCGLIGSNDFSGFFGTCSNSFWDTDVTESSTDPGCPSGGKTTAEMKDVATYTDTSTAGLDSPWDFTGNQNDDTGNYDIWYFSGSNSYSELIFNKEFDHEICYDRIFGIAYNNPNPHTCSAGNKLAGLFKEFDSLAEIPSLNNYGTDVCYGSLTCSARDIGCNSNELPVLALDTSTDSLLTDPNHMPDGMVSWWRLDGESPEISADDCAGSNAGSLRNIQVSSNWVAGKSGNALLFDGTDDFVEVNDDNSLDFNNGFSIEGWIKRGAFDDIRINTILAKGDTSGSSVNYELRINDLTKDDAIELIWHDTALRGGGSISLKDTASFHHMAATYNSTSDVVSIYLDGILVESFTETQSITPNNDRLTIGSSNEGNSGFFNGIIDEVAVYNIPISEEEIKHRYYMGMYERKICCEKPGPPAVNIDYAGPLVNPHSFGPSEMGYTYAVTYTATAIDYSGKGINAIRIFIDDDNDMIFTEVTPDFCDMAAATPYCTFAVGTGYSSGQTVNFYSEADDNDMKTGTSATESFTVCSLDSVSMSDANCDPVNGCVPGNAIDISAVFSGTTCPANPDPLYVQIDATSGDGCDIEADAASGADMVGISSEIDKVLFTGTWTVPSINGDCRDKTVSPTAATLRDQVANPSTWEFFGTNAAGGQIHFANVDISLFTMPDPLYVKYGDTITINSLANGAGLNIRLNCSETDGGVTEMSGHSCPSGSTIITNCQELQDMQNDPGGDYCLSNNIDCSATNEWNGGQGFLPIDNFGGVLEGNGHAIDGLYIDTGTYAGLFKSITSGGTVKNLGLTNVYIDSLNTKVGGIAGINEGTIVNSYVTGFVTSPDHEVGGLVGYNNGFVSNSYFSGTVIGNGYVGGLVGMNFHQGDIYYSNSSGTVTGYGNYVGGLVGYCGEGEIINSFSLMDVNGVDYAGGLIGYSDGYITNTYSTGNVNGGNPGGLVAYNARSCVDSFWDMETSGMPVSDCGTGKTTAEMKDIATFTDTSTPGLNTAWDFDGNPNDDTGNMDIWDIDPSINDGYPYIDFTTRAGYYDICDTNNFAPNNPTCELVSEWTENESKTIYCIIENENGATTLQVSINVFSDNQPPIVTWNLPIESSYFKDGSVIDINAGAADRLLDDNNNGAGINDGAPCNPLIDGMNTSFTETAPVTYSSATGECSGIITLNSPSNLADGPHYVTITINDSLNNTNATSGYPRAINSDNIGPECIMMHPGMNLIGEYWSPGKFNLTWNGTDLAPDGSDGAGIDYFNVAYYKENSQNYSIYDENFGLNMTPFPHCESHGPSQRNCTLLIGVLENNKKYFFNCTATDVLGNAGRRSNTVNTTIDGLEPLTEFIQPSGNWINSSKPDEIILDVKWKITENQTGVNCSFFKIRDCAHKASPGNLACTDWGEWYVVVDNASGMPSECIQPVSCACGECVENFLFNGSGINVTTQARLFNPIEELNIYDFDAWAWDNAGNKEIHIANDPIVDLSKPHLVTNVSVEWNNGTIHSINNTLIIDQGEIKNIYFNSSAWDNESGIQISNIEYDVISPAASAHYNKTSFNGASFCDGPSGPNPLCVNRITTGWIPYDPETIYFRYRLWAIDKAGNINSSSDLGWIYITSYPLANFMTHNVHLSLGLTHDLRIQVRNLQNEFDTISIDLDGYPNACFLNASHANVKDCRSLEIGLNPYEDRIVTVRILAEEVRDAPYTLNLNAQSGINPGLTDKDSASISIKYPAMFPGLSSWAIIIIILLSVSVYMGIAPRHAIKK